MSLVPRANEACTSQCPDKLWRSSIGRMGQTSACRRFRSTINTIHYHSNSVLHGPKVYKNIHPPTGFNILNLPITSRCYPGRLPSRSPSMNRSSLNLSRPSQEKGHAASGDLFLSPTSEPFPPERAASTDQCLDKSHANLPDHQDATDNMLLRPKILPSQQLPLPSANTSSQHLYNVCLEQVREPWIDEQRQQMQLQQRVIHQDTPYTSHQSLSSGVFGLQQIEQPWEVMHQWS